jgi:hypothetical protein
MNWRERLQRMHPNTLSRALGWFSIGLGAVELLAPRGTAQAAGLGGGRNALVRACGAREVLNGVALLRSMDPEPYLWARVAGDGMDLAAVGLRAWSGSRSTRTRAGVALAVLAGVTALDVMAVRRLRRRQTERPVRDYGGRTGFPRPADQMRGAARRALRDPEHPVITPASSDGPTLHGRDAPSPAGTAGAVH